jgi:putative heme-binding domain-containing protein
VLGEVKVDDSMLPLLDTSIMAKDGELQRAALTAVSAFEDSIIGERLLSEYANFSSEVRPAFFDVMLSRVPWTTRLVDTLADGTLDVKEIPRDVVEQLRRHGKPQIADKATALFGPSQTSQRSELIEQVEWIRDVITDGSGNPYEGESIYLQRCAACHKLFHKGGNVGPDLTPYQRGNLDTLLTSVVQPSAEIREGFEQVMVLTVNGRILTGFLTDRDSQVTTLRGKSGEDIRVEREEIESIEPVGRSLMPDGLLEGLNEEQLRDFFAYLRISQPISK